MRLTPRRSARQSPDPICGFVADRHARATELPDAQRTRHLLIRQQTSVINAIRAHLAEFGIVAPVERNGVDQRLGIVADASDKRLPELARACVAALGTQLGTLKARILGAHRRRGMSRTTSTHLPSRHRLPPSHRPQSVRPGVSFPLPLVARKSAAGYAAGRRRKRSGARRDGQACWSSPIRHRQ